jgi:hypothetical protein
MANGQGALWHHFNVKAALTVGITDQHIGVGGACWKDRQGQATG